MGSMYDNFKSDPELERNGIVVDYGDFRVTLARAGGANKAYQRTLEQMARPYRRAIDTGTFTNERANALLREVYARTVVRNWEIREVADDGTVTWKEGIEGSDGTVLPVSKENILATFDALPDLFQDLMQQAQSGALYRASLREQASGNL